MARILIAGGDRRSFELFPMLKEKGHDVKLIGFSKLDIKDDVVSESPEYVVLPIPYRMPDGQIKAPFANEPLYLADIYAQYPNSVYFLGGYDSQAEAVFDGKARYIDLLADEAFLVRNALITAEAAVCVFEKESQTALCDLCCVVIGYGRIGKFLCRILAAHGAQVIATARKPADIELIKAQGFKAVNTGDVESILTTADVVFNTVPVHVLGEPEMQALSKKGALYMELASLPFGMDIDKAKQMGVRVQVELGLPGRLFPVSAARAILQVLEREVET